MKLAGLGRRGLATVGTGVVGVAAVEGVKRLARLGTLRAGAVSATAWGLRGRRGAETVAEGARLVAGDIVAEARQRVGEQAPTPGAAGDVHDH